MDQAERIQQYTKGELPPPVRILLRFSTATSAAEVLERARQVIGLVASAQKGEWPSDDEWRRSLPGWFVGSFEGHNLEDLLADSSLWDFGSWLDAMKNPGWEWWSCEAAQRSGTVRCMGHSAPFAIEPLIYLLRISGASDVEFREE
jgi:hypothetical protein